MRNYYLKQPNEDLLRDCTLDFFKAPGNGGQKRNKTSSAVRLIHRPTGIAVTDCSERSQHRNRANALTKLRLAIALAGREAVEPSPLTAACSMSHPDYPLWAARIFDAAAVANWDVAATADSLGWSKSHLLKMLTRDPALWQKLLEERARAGLPFLHA